MDTQEGPPTKIVSPVTLALCNQLMVNFVRFVYQISRGLCQNRLQLEY